MLQNRQTSHSLFVVCFLSVPATRRRLCSNVISRLLSVRPFHLSANVVFVPAVSGAERRTPAVRAPVFLLQPPHVINHVKWQKAQHCQDCEGDLMELKMGCFVPMQSILFHLGLACLLSPCPKTEKCSFWCQVPTVKAGSPSRQQDRREVWACFCCKKDSVCEFGSLRQLCTHACLSGAAGLFYAGLHIGSRLGVKIVFIFHFFRTNPPIPRWKIK